MKTWKIQPCTFKTLTLLYELTAKILKTHLRPFEHKIGKRIGHNYTVKQIMTIFEEYGTPANVEIIYPEPLPIRAGNNSRPLRGDQ